MFRSASEAIVGSTFESAWWPTAHECKALYLTHPKDGSELVLPVFDTSDPSLPGAPAYHPAPNLSATKLMR